MSSENRNLPSTTEKLPEIRDDAVRYDSDYIDTDYVDIDYIDTDENKTSPKGIGKLVAAVKAFFTTIRFLFLSFVTRVRKVTSPAKEYIKKLVTAEANNLRQRLPLLKTPGFMIKFVLSVIAVTAYLFLCAFIATKNGSMSEYMTTFFVVLGICSVILFSAAFLNPYKAAPTLYAFLTCMLIVTGVLLQTMLDSATEYRGTLSMVLNMVVGIVGGLIGSGAVIFFLRSDKRKVLTICLAGLSVAIIVFALIKNDRINGAANWIILGPITIQISEIVKVMAIAVIASVYSMKEYSEKKRILMSTVYTFIIVGLFVLCYEFGTPIILVLAFLIITWLSTNSLKKLMSVCVCGSVLLIIALSIAGTTYDNLYDISPYTKDTLQSIETEVDRILLGNDAAENKDDKSPSLLKEEKDSKKTYEKDYVSYSKYTVTANQIKPEAEEGETKPKEELILKTKMLLTFVCKAENSKATANKLSAFFTSDRIELKDNVEITHVSSPVKKDDYYRFEVYLMCTKDLTGTDSVSLLLAKSYYKILERLNLAGTQYHSQKILDIARMVKWFGTENKLLLEVPNMSNDSIFSYALFQLGLAMTILILLIYIIKFLIVVCTSFRLRDTALAMTVIGYSICISIQSIIQLSMGLSIVPIIGICSAFLSSGGTNFLASVAMTFVILYSMRAKKPVIQSKNKEEVSE